MRIETYLEDSVRRLPDKVALVDGDRRVTYRQLDELSNLTLSTATVDGVEKSLDAIQDDMQSIADAQGDLNDERKQQVESANKQFTSQLESIANGLTSNLSLSGAEQKLKDATQQLASSYKGTFAEVDCG